MEIRSPEINDSRWKNEPDMDELGRVRTLLAADPQMAVAKFEELAARDSTGGKWYLADAYYTGVYLRRDLEKAKYWFKEAGRVGLPEAAFMQGRILFQQERYWEAFPPLVQSADLGYAPAMYRLAKMHQDGLGTKKDIIRSRQLLELAAAQGHIFAKRDLAILYLNGTYGRKSVWRGALLLAPVIWDIFALLVQAIRVGPIVDHRMQL
jgi:TPR repeat protein